MNFRTCLLLIFSLCLSSLVHGQIRFSETIQSSKIASAEENALYFVDFWATWCGPCVYATEYLEVLQKQYPNRFYVISLSEENPDKVKRHLAKRPTDLAVSIDYDGENFDQNKVRVLPYGILLNAKGKILWKGSPTDFKATDLKRFLKQNKDLASFDAVFKTESLEDSQVVEVYVPAEDFEIKELKDRIIESLEVDGRSEYVEFKGSLSDILVHRLQVSVKQVVVPFELNKTYQIYIKKEEELLSNILSALNIELSDSEVKGDVLVIDNSESNFWDSKQIDWGKDTARFLIDDNQIQADNVTFW